jgi:hypothetical protein
MILDITDADEDMVGFPLIAAHLHVVRSIRAGLPRRLRALRIRTNRYRIATQLREHEGMSNVVDPNGADGR